MGNEQTTYRWNPTLVEETAGGSCHIEIRSKLMAERKLFLLGEITDELAIDFAIQFKYLSMTKEPVDIYINSPGGSVNAGLLIYDLIQEADFEVNLYCIGHAASMGAIILAGGQKGRRYILPHSKVMIHEPLIGGGVGGSATSIQKTAQSILETRNITNGLLSKHTGKSRKAIDKATAYDNYMNAEEAVEFGICDEIKGML